MQGRRLDPAVFFLQTRNGHSNTALSAWGRRTVFLSGSFHGVFQTRPDVIHVHFGNIGKLLLPLKRIEPSVVFITMFHGHDLLIGLAGGKDYYAALFSEADLILANSEFTRARLLEQGADDQRIRIHYVGIEIDKFPYRKELPRHDREIFRVVTVARLCEQR